MCFAAPLARWVGSLKNLTAIALKTAVLLKYSLAYCNIGRSPCDSLTLGKGLPSLPLKFDAYASQVSQIQWAVVKPKCWSEASFPFRQRRKECYGPIKQVSQLTYLVLGNSEVFGLGGVYSTKVERV